MAPPSRTETETVTTVPTRSFPKPPKPKPKSKPKPKPSISFALAKTLIDHLRSLNVQILPPLTDNEIVAIEFGLRFTFPPDLRSILQVGLPFGNHFPEWRDSSVEQLRDLLNLPVRDLRENVSRNFYWSECWGHRPPDNAVALVLVDSLLKTAPVLVPVFKNCYVATTTSNFGGNPVFYVDKEVVRVLCFDVSRFFQQIESFPEIDDFSGFRREEVVIAGAKEARKVDFWTEVAETGRTPGLWWRRVEENGDAWTSGLSACLDEAYCRLNAGGWKDDEISKMMMMTKRTAEGCDLEDDNGSGSHKILLAEPSNGEEDDLTWRLDALSDVLLRAGWSREDVVYALDIDIDIDNEKEGKDDGSSSVTTLKDLLTVDM